MSTDEKGKLNGVLLDTKDLAHMLKVSPRTIQTWRTTGEGPPFIRLARNSPRYRIEDVQKWLDDRLCKNTIQSHQMEERNER